MHNNPLRASEDVDDVLNKYADMVYKIAFSHTKNKSDADDVFQNVFLRYIRCKKTFQSEEHKRAYLIRAAINQSKTLFLSAWFRKTEPICDELVFETEEDNGIYDSVLKLPPKYRTVIQLHYYEDMSVREIAKALNTKESTIKSQLHRARLLLKEYLKGEHDIVW
jgi:RNA polymerase sigma-70 factor (ECF subfamily)